MGTGLFGWGFTLTRFADVYSQKFGTNREFMMKKLWGDNFWDPKAKKWKTTNIGEDGSKLKRGFVQFVMEPIIRLCRSAMKAKLNYDENTEEESRKEAIKVEKILGSIGVELKNEDRALQGKPLMKKIFQKWINVADALIEMIVMKLPSPVEAQAYRASHLYEGPIDDSTGQAIQKCDKDGPLCVYISKMLPGSDNNFIAFGRVFSGTVKAGQKVRIMGPNYKPGDKTDLVTNKSVQRVVIAMNNKFESVPEVPCGNLVGLVGIDKFLAKQGTLATEEDSHNIKAMKFSVSPVVRVAVKVKTQSDQPKLVDGLKRLARSDPLVQCTTD